MKLITRHPLCVYGAVGTAALALTLAQAQVQAPAARSAGADPVAVFMAYQNALNAGDAGATAEIWAVDARFEGAMGCPVAKPCVGREAVRAGFIDPAVAMKMKHHVVGEPELLGPDELQVRIEVSWPGIDRDDPSVQRLAGTDRVRIRDGRIVSKVYTPDQADEQTRRYYEAVARARASATSAQQR